MKKMILFTILLSSILCAQESTSTSANATSVKVDTTGASLEYVNGLPSKTPLSSNGEFQKKRSSLNFSYAQQNIDAMKKQIRGLR